MSCAMAMNSPPRSRKRTASDPMTPTSESALEIGCLCSTRFTPQTTAIPANRKNRIESIGLKERHQKTGHEKIQNGHGEHKGPGEMHELVVTETGQRRAYPYIKKQNDSDLRGEPKQGHQDRGNYRRDERRGHAQEYNAGHRKGDFVEGPRRIEPVIETQQRPDEEDD